MALPLPARGAMLAIAVLLDTGLALVLVEVAGTGTVSQFSQLIENWQRTIDLEMCLGTKRIGMTVRARTSGRRVIESGTGPGGGDMAIAAGVA